MKPATCPLDVLCPRCMEPVTIEIAVGRLSGTPIAVINASTYLTVSQAADYTQRPSVEAFRQAIKSSAVPPCHANSSVLYARLDLDAWLKGKKYLRRAS